MAKHMLRVRPYRLLTGPGLGLVHMSCDNCPRFFQLNRAAMYDLLVNKSRVLAEDVDAEAVKEWGICEPRNQAKGIT
jgi:hypothetical protein